MSEHVRAVRVDGKEVEVVAFPRCRVMPAHREAFTALMRDESLVIPYYLHESKDGRRLFLVDFGIVSVVHEWDGKQKKWVQVKP